VVHFGAEYQPLNPISTFVNGEYINDNPKIARYMVLTIKKVQHIKHKMKIKLSYCLNFSKY
jgi:hypothetical protein